MFLFHSLLDKATTIATGSARITRFFEIDPITAEITTRDNKPVDLEKIGTNNIGGILMVTDSGGLSDTAELNLTIYDVNDHAPKFRQERNYIQVQEDTIVGETIWTAKARDEDRSSKLTYKLISVENLKNQTDFTMNPQTGGLIVNSELDFETKQTYEFRVEASDGEFIGYTNLYINVLDVNDVKPIWSKNLQTDFVLEENISGGFKIAQFTAIDTDESARLRYKVVNTKPIKAAGWFTLHPFSGVLATSPDAIIDRERVEEVKLELLAVDTESIKIVFC